MASGLRPVGLTVDAAGNIYVTSDNGNVVYQVTPAGGIGPVVSGAASDGYPEGVGGCRPSFTSMVWFDLPR